MIQPQTGSSQAIEAATDHADAEGKVQDRLGALGEDERFFPAFVGSGSSAAAARKTAPAVIGQSSQVMYGAGDEVDQR